MPSLSTITLSAHNLPLVSLALLALGAIVVLRARRKRTASIYPPGPKPLPLVGNLFDVPWRNPWLHFTEWRKTYGDLVYMHVLGNDIIVINSLEVSADLHFKQSRFLADRPALPLIHFLGGGFAVPMMRHDEHWRRHRTLLHRKFSVVDIGMYQDMELTKSHQLLQKLLNDPKEFGEHLKNYNRSIIAHVAYGYEPAEGPDAILDLSESMTLVFNNIMYIATILQPPVIFQTFIEWFPGSQYLAKKSRAVVKNVLDGPFNFVKNSIADGTAIPSFTSDLLDKFGSDENQELGIDEHFLKESGASIYTAGIDTTTAALTAFIHLMFKFKDVQKKAQEEIDRVIGHERLPDFGDRKSLPYLEAIYLEVLRYRPVTPLSLPHATTEDFHYGEYFIPAGTAVVSNVWSMTRDESVYEKPHEFNPERFLLPDGTLNEDAGIPSSYGFGRRMCVGRHLAEDMLWVSFASILSVFDIEYATDASGKPVGVDEHYPDNTISLMKPFECTITPRSEEKRKLVQMTNIL